MEHEVSPKGRVLPQSVFFALFFGLLAWAVHALLLHFGLFDRSWAVFWPLNGVVVACMLTRPRRRWALLLLPVALGMATGQALAGGSWIDAAVDALLNTAEVVAAASLLPPFTELRPWLKERHLVLRFFTAAFVAGPAVSGALAAWYYRMGLTYAGLWQVLEIWVLPHALGMAATLPLVLAVCRRSAWRALRPWHTARTLLVLAVTAALSVVVLSTGQYTLLFLLFPVLALVIFHTEFAGAMMAIELICIVSVYCTLHGHGSYMVGGVERRGLFVQMFLAYIVMLGFPVAVLLAERRDFASQLAERERQYRRLAESSRDMIVLTSFHGVREFVSPACMEVLGLLPGQLQGQHFSDGIHPDDVELCNSVLLDLRLGLSDDAVLTYRTLTAAGDYIWVEGRLRAVTDDTTGDVTGCLATVRDISEHRRLRQKLEEACIKLEHEASFDALTNVANRRRFDDIFDQEWRRAAREGQPLALLMVDIDHFKEYNDRHGHPAGDECLRAVAQTIAAFARRPGDMVARYGGEEFAVLLPVTELNGGFDLADKIRRAVEQLEVTPPTVEEGAGEDPCTDWPRQVTVSIGCAAMVPLFAADPYTLVGDADRALYLAKHNGRNRVEAKPGPRPVLPASAILA